jgi:hypothetical protein
MDEAHIPAPSIIANPDPRMPASVVYAYTVEDLLFTGKAYWQVLEMDNTTGRPLSAQWIASDRVFQQLDQTSKFVIGYSHSFYHLAGGTDLLSLSFNFNDFKKKSTN